MSSPEPAPEQERMALRIAELELLYGQLQRVPLLALMGEAGTVIAMQADELVQRRRMPTAEMVSDLAAILANAHALIGRLDHTLTVLSGAYGDVPGLSEKLDAVRQLSDGLHGVRSLEDRDRLIRVFISRMRKDWKDHGK